MSDITERLRKPLSLCFEAADRIERLEALLEWVLPYITDPDVVKKITRALGEPL
jgi:hypothetical protein